MEYLGGFILYIGLFLLRKYLTKKNNVLYYVDELINTFNQKGFYEQQLHCR